MTICFFFRKNASSLILILQVRPPHLWGGHGGAAVSWEGRYFPDGGAVEGAASLLGGPPPQGPPIRVEEEMDFFEKSKSEKLLFCIKVWKNAKKNLGPIGPFWNMRNWQIKKTYLHYMSIFQSCRILVFYSLNESIRGVQEENIIMLGFSSRILVGI